MSITCIEDLSNEIFHEIFDYLDGRDIYNGFSNLNNRFQQLLNCSSLLYKIKLCSPSDEKFMNYSKQIALINKHQIFSISLWPSSHIDESLSTFIIDSSLDRLESITLYCIEENALILLLNNLTCLPRLFSLTIETNDYLEDASDVYRSIFAVPKLTYVKIQANDWVHLTSLPIATTNQQFSHVKYLIIDHCCTFDQLAIILSYTPELCHLNFQHEPERNSTMEMILSIPLLNLTHVYIDFRFINADKFLTFIEKLSSKLKVFHVIIRDDHVIYLTSPLWERIILQHFPELENFSLTFFESNDDEDEDEDYAWSDDQFTSSFWIERKWIFHAEIDTDEIIYSIYPYKKTWYDCVEIDTNSMVSVQQKINCTSSILTIKDPFYVECPKLLFENIVWVTTVTSIYHLEFPRGQIFIRRLMNIINFLPNLISLKIWSLSLLKSKCFSRGQKEFISDVANNNTITKVYIENMIKFGEISSLIDLFPRMKYLQVGWTNNIDIELFVRIILMKIIKKSNNDIRSLCFCIQMADDEMVKKLQNMIDYKKLLFDYRIKRISDKIYLQWG